MNKAPQSVRGMNDILPEEARRWRVVEEAMSKVFDAYGYAEIRLPVVEHTGLFARAIGEATDIVEKEMYTFDDRNGDSLALRPEGTAGCVRAAMEHGLLHNQVQRLWYRGPMFRYERPQKGRYRQFNQVGAEAFGLAGPDVDAEIILLSARILAAAGAGGVELRINTLGTPAERARYRQRLQTYLESRRGDLDEDSVTRIERNPMRVLDSKHPRARAVVAEAPGIEADLDAESTAHFHRVGELLDAAGVRYVHDPRLVRGLDYYTRTVFEWTSDRLGAQDAVCSGGRYDGLVEALGGRPTPAIGWALGIERLVALADASTVSDDATPHAYFVAIGERAESHAIMTGERLRDRLPGLRLVVNCGGGGMKAQMKRADKCGARLALIVGDDEMDAGTVTVKSLREDAPQESVAVTGLMDALLARFGETLLT